MDRPAIARDRTRLEDGPVVVLAGGTGGAKLARGMLDLVGSELVVVANVGDDVEIYGGHVSPDPDLISFWLADRIDERGWGLRDDSFATMDGLRELGLDVWFALGDRDLAIAVERARALDDGSSLTEAQERITRRLGIEARVLPVSDRPIRTRVLAGGRWWALQEFMIRHRGEGPVDDVQFRHARAARCTPAVLDAIRTARAIVIGPSNPIISIGPILAVPGAAQALTSSAAPVIAVSPLVHGAVLKGPTAACLRWAGHRPDSEGIAAAYAGVIDGLVADEPATAVPTRVMDVLLDTAQRRRQVADEVLRFAGDVAAGRGR